MALRRLVTSSIVGATALMLSSCGLLSPGPGGIVDDSNYHQVAEARMETIVDAIDSQDSAGLVAMFSARALEDSSQLEADLDALLLHFPNGIDQWAEQWVVPTTQISGGKRTVMMESLYTVEADGANYWLLFIDFTKNDAIDPENVGLVALGVAPRTEARDSPEEVALSSWKSQFDIEGNAGPAVYSPWV